MWGIVHGENFIGGVVCSLGHIQWNLLGVILTHAVWKVKARFFS